MQLTTIKSEGSLIPADLLDTIYAGEAEGQKAEFFGLNGKVRLIDEIASCWSDAKAYWEAFQHGINRVSKDESGATVTREQWILPLLRTLGFNGIRFSPSAIVVGDNTYPISHRLGEEERPLPVHIEGANIELDQRSPTGRPRISPHALVQEYLNRTDALWGIVTNGKQFRILRDSARLTRPSYLEFNIEEMMEGEHFTDFQLFYRIVHRTRFPKVSETAHDCLLEEYYQSGIETGGRVRDRLRDGVEEALKLFGNGFLVHPDNAYLLELIREGKLAPTDYYRQLLRLIYRFLFLMVSEERKLVGPDPKKDKLFKLFTQNYSINRLREKVEHAVDHKERYWDLWEGVKQTFRLYCDKRAGDLMCVDVLNGDLFGPHAIPELEKSFLYNKDFLRGFAHLALFKEDKSIRRINYGYLDVEELGSVYESLLDFHPVFKDMDNQPRFDLAYGTERKSTGSYYTRPELVQELIKSALVPVIEERLESAETNEEQERALLSLKVCDPASGSGHFLLAGARRIGTELARVRSGEDQPTPTEFRKAVRDVIQNCIYGVDINPLAVDLCKVALWLEGHNRGYPLTFLDHRIKCGNSLVGIDTLDRLQEGIPNEAFNPVTGDDKEVVRKIKARNRLELKAWESGQLPLIKDIEEEFKTDLRSFAHEVQRVDTIVERKADDVGKKQEEYEKLRASKQWHRDWTAANIWTSAFFYPLTDENDPSIPTHEKLVSYLAKPGAAHGQLVGKANALSAELRFFHWSLEFPDVFQSGGFDVVLGNPPWERIKLQEQEFFATRDAEIAKAPNKAKRTKLIKSLAETNPQLLREFEDAKHEAESNSRFARHGRRFFHTSVGDINTYALFAELFRALLNNEGMAGIIVPTGIVTDDTTKWYFNDLMRTNSLVSVLGFINEQRIFPTILHNFKFCAITISGERRKITEADFAFLCYNFEDAKQDLRHFKLSLDDLELLNPNTRTCPIFRTQQDAALTKKLYINNPVLIHENCEQNEWGISFLSMFHMANDSHFFNTNPSGDVLPLYEGKMVYQYDHRFASYESLGVQERLHMLPETPESHHINPYYQVQPCYYVNKIEVEKKLNNRTDKKWVLVFRVTTSSGLSRTVISTILPKVAVGGKLPIIIPDSEYIVLVSCLLANLNTIVLDFVGRLKIGGADLSLFILKQLPILGPNSYTKNDILFISPRVLELVFTSWDIKAFADDIWRDSDEYLRQAVQKQWQENKSVTGGHESNPPEWAEINDLGIPLPPFKWDEERRAVLRAELDAYYAKLYGLNRDELRYILDPQDVYGPDFPGETFRVLKEKETRQYGENRTRRLVLEAWDRLFGKES